MAPKRKAGADDSSVPSKRAKSSTGPNSDRTNWEEVEFVIKAHDNIVPDPYGATSTTTAPLKWAEVASLFNQRFGRTIGAAACEKRYRQKIAEYRLRDPAYPDPKTIAYVAKTQPAKKGAQKGTQRPQPLSGVSSQPTKPPPRQPAGTAIGKQLGDVLGPQDSEESDSEESIEDSDCDTESDQMEDAEAFGAAELNVETSVTTPTINEHEEMVQDSVPQKRYVDEHLKKSAAVCEQILPKELRGIARPEFYFEYGGPVTKEDFEKRVTFEVTTSDGLKCGSVDMLSNDIRANSDFVDMALIYDRRIGVTLEVQGYSNSIVEIFAQCCHPSIDKDDLPECLPACVAHQKHVLSRQLAGKAKAPVCLPDCLQNQLRHCHIPTDTAREDLPQYLRVRTGESLLPEYHYTLVRQRKANGDLQLLPVVRRIEWTMEELVELYLLATELNVGHIRDMVMHRWLQTMQGAAPPLDFAPEVLNRLFTHPEVGERVKLFFAQWVHQEGLVDHILDSEEDWEEDFAQLVYCLQRGLEQPPVVVPLCGPMPKPHEPDLKALTTRLLQAASRDYTAAYNQLVRQLPASRESGVWTASTKIDGAEPLFHDFLQKKRILEQNKLEESTVVGLDEGNNLSDAVPDVSPKIWSDRDSSSQDDSEDEEEL
ncbi:uncharacterized protein EI97DRAFT_441939 [Westerdykella ornata]|uniref:Uncharacterized protein n=1 Tax=Westerdykella ornata TaxID=318751 RepID=A0A6A6JLS2_WESOR|nr:uncharacterized protein EI97DRAFT_441939 [Westerdykella ornata]KAF2277194.1 hypothetical protein EI97DRAFT_441939 [Westerdykella ornata]